mmetsp:Transcript_17585/g.54515  ORF Transcript_17585/g.54515 Transcript_17585/m.54515 type:complete len:234 (-) Transcript_17585:181-882(-)
MGSSTSPGLTWTRDLVAGSRAGEGNQSCTLRVKVANHKLDTCATERNNQLQLGSPWGIAFVEPASDKEANRGRCFDARQNTPPCHCGWAGVHSAATAAALWGQSASRLYALGGIGDTRHCEQPRPAVSRETRWRWMPWDVGSPFAAPRGSSSWLHGLTRSRAARRWLVFPSFSVCVLFFLPPSQPGVALSIEPARGVGDHIDAQVQGSRCVLFVVVLISFFPRTSVAVRRSKR